MLIQFNFKNFKSFKNDTSLDLSATKENELSFHIIKEGNEKILPVAIIYGANASGKSNVQEALDYMKTFVLRSLSYGEESKEEKYQRPITFLFDEKSRNEVSSFEVYFTLHNDDKGNTYNYGFSLDNNGVVEEWLNYKARTGRKYLRIFFRSEDELLLDGIPTRNRDNLKIALNKKTLIVSLGAKLKVEKLASIYNFFANIEIADFGQPIQNLILSKNAPAHLDEDENVRKDVINFFNSFDESIVDLKVESVRVNNYGKEEIAFRIEAGHKTVDSDELVYIPLSNESAGTLKMFALYPFVEETLRRGGLLFVDELNARLHPLLVRCFVQLFLDHDKNKNNAQLIFTSHDSWQLNNGSFRRDEIWFTEKENDGTSTLFSLAEFGGDNGIAPIRSDENFEKNYLLGKYGAIPFMKTFELKLDGDLDGK